MSRQEFRLHGIRTDGEGPRLVVFTPAGKAHEIPLDRSRLTGLMRDAVEALQELDLAETKGAKS